MLVGGFGLLAGALAEAAESPAFSPDGQWVAFRRRNQFMTISTDGGSPQPIGIAPMASRGLVWADDGLLVFGQANANVHDVSTSPDGKFIAMNAIPGSTGEDILVAPPDGRWLSYVSDESGRPEVYVRAFPGPGGQWQVSTDGGTEPVWARGGNELFYRHDREMMSVAVKLSPTFAPGGPVRLFEGSYAESHRSHPNDDVARDGQRFLMIKDQAMASLRGSIGLPASRVNRWRSLTDWTAALGRAKSARERGVRRVGLFVGVVGTADQRAGFDMREPEAECDALELAELVRVVVARHHRVVL